ncbi:YlmH family RNA-binding protein [Virgibacillus siamensis]|uniref:YlmH family RNA-binding protein n=1 Tax=Virgibacillus siamensis TaxID=480071 RepID=UPI000986C486|nr:RNA-binding protein [Virgibacillus siamensis]
MDIYQHFREEEQPFIDNVLSWIEQAERTYQVKLTDFLDPREQQIVDMLIGTGGRDINVYMNGGNELTERKRVILAPLYDTIDNEDFQLTLLQGSYHEKFVTMTHRDVMGAFLSQGIKRQKLGDIIVGNGLIQIVAADEIAPYIIANLTSIKQAKIRLEEKPLTSLVVEQKNWKTADKTVSSLRLDAVLKVIYNLSRKDAAEMINKQLVKVNFKIVDDTKFSLQEGDLISLRGKGRSKLEQINGRTKKDNWNITIGILQ